MTAHSPLSKRDAVAIVREAAAGMPCVVRVASAAADARARRRMQASFARGDFATWGYDARRARRAADPSKILPGARSVICVAVAYATPPSQGAPLSGRVSRYAWSQDYHGVLSRTLAEAAARIDARAGRAVTAVACDTKPIAERAFAARAGLGWIGKHTGLIEPQAGSFVFLGEIVTTLALEPDPPVRKSCGACMRCVAACPTNALRGDYTIDAGRCISDLTQRTDGVPRELRALVGMWVWGCDVCQEVCPPTQRAGSGGAAQFAPASAQTAAPDLQRLLRMRSAVFRREFAATAMGWRGAAVLRRNAAVALGNALDRSTVPSLRDALERDPHPMVRGHAAWALGRIGSPAAIDALRARRAVEGDARVCEEIEAAMSDVLAP
jgi:epoxyqueuosine reductase